MVEVVKGVLEYFESRGGGICWLGMSVREIEPFRMTQDFTWIIFVISLAYCYVDRNPFLTILVTAHSSSHSDSMFMKSSDLPLSLLMSQFNFSIKKLLNSKCLLKA